MLKVGDKVKVLIDIDWYHKAGEIAEVIEVLEGDYPILIQFGCEYGCEWNVEPESLEKL